MSAYDFRSLSSQDFEELVRDLLQQEWGVHIESFKQGKDQGIDLRYSPLNNGDTIIQCKHYVGSGFRALVHYLKNKELHKVKSLSPSRYVLVTSLALTPHNKSEISRLFSPFVHTTSDIIGQDDMNNLLLKHPNIETKHFKLWLTSNAVLERVLKNATMVQSDFKIEKITAKLPLYVQTASLQEAFKILEDNHFLIISGIPGIGKTILAEILLYVYLARGYAPIQVTENIREAFDLYCRDKKQIFYYDDFLGQTILHDRFGKNEDAAIIEFVNLVRVHKNVRFVMTTREYILQSANLQYEKISTSDLESAKYILELSDYSKRDKAHILYNHVYFSKLPAAYVDELLNKKFYFKIIEHMNYSPRIIEWMTNMQHVYYVPVENYRSFFKETLDRPYRLWAHAYDNQIEEASQILLLVLYSLGTEARIDVLREAFIACQKQYVELYNVQSHPKDFQFALKELEGTFTLTTQKSVKLHSSSVKDFLELKLFQEPDIIGLLLSSVTYFSQLINLWRLSSEAQKSPHSYFRVNLKKQLVIDAINRTLKNGTMVIESSGGVTAFLEQDATHVSRALFITEFFRKHKDPKLLDLLNQAIANIIELVKNNQDEYEWGFNFDEFKDLIRSVVKMQDIAETSHIEILKKLKSVLVYAVEKAYWLEDIMAIEEAFRTCSQYVTMEEDCIREALDRYLLENFYDQYSHLDNSFELHDLASKLDTIGERYGIDVSNQISQLYNKADEQEEHEDEYSDEQYEMWREIQHLANEENESIENMFGTLRDK